VTSENYN
jgi:hypothetical protein